MVTHATVQLWGKNLGQIIWDKKKNLGYLEYDRDFLASGIEPAPITMPLEGAQGKLYSFPTLRKQQTFSGLPGLVADSLPDKYGTTLINAWLVANGRNPDTMNPVEKLCFIGTRGMGALTYVPTVHKTTTKAQALELSQLVQIAEQVLANKTKLQTTLDDQHEEAVNNIIMIGTSAGGARAKALIAYNETTHEVRTGQAEAPEGFEHWLIKFDGVTDQQSGVSSGFGAVEMAYYLMAKDAGLEMAECRLLKEHGRSHFMTKRFDRRGSKGKLHYQSLCAMRHWDFNDIDTYSYEQVFMTMNMLKLDYAQAEQMYRRMVFNVLARNCDDHTKNFGFLMRPTTLKWELAPAFDICHAYRPNSTWVSHHALSINGKRHGEHITEQDLLMVAQYASIKKPAKILEDVKATVSKWQQYAEEAAVPVHLREQIQSTLLV